MQGIQRRTHGQSPSTWDLMNIHSFYQQFFLPNMQYIQGPVLALSGRRRECSIGWPPLICQQLSLGFLVSLSSQPLKGCHLHVTGEETDASSTEQSARDHTHQMAEAAPKLSSADSNLHASFCRKNKDITYPPEMDPWAREKEQR